MMARTPRFGGVEVPLPVPVIVEQGFLVTALCAVVLTIPLMYFYGVCGGRLLNHLEQTFHFSLSVPLVVVFMAAGLTAVTPPVILGFSRTSKFIVECARWYVDQGNASAAKRLVAAVDYQVWYREWKRLEWFRAFAAQSSLLEQSSRFQRFSRRCPPPLPPESQ